MPSPWTGAEVQAEGVVLRPWTHADEPVLVELFDTAEIDRWTPLAHPFDTAAATAYVDQAHAGLSSGTLQLAITLDGAEPLGEVLLFDTEESATCELAYAVGSNHRGRGLAARAVRAILPVARRHGHGRARLRVDVDNAPSQRVATAAGFTLTEEPLVRRERKGHVLHLATWRRLV
ncbi:MAG TPA: GNAT family N-acetyltransferase [Marmoricola sp.]|nr:GNAT family N-acetyltransferase [Marmoricola sp.]